MNDTLSERFVEPFFSSFYYRLLLAVAMTAMSRSLRSIVYTIKAEAIIIASSFGTSVLLGGAIVLAWASSRAAAIAGQCGLRIVERPIRGSVDLVSAQHGFVLFRLEMPLTTLTTASVLSSACFIRVSRMAWNPGPEGCSGVLTRPPEESSIRLIPWCTTKSRIRLGVISMSNLPST